MSKNVAVFVDVANIFYAAKAAGVDIDYVTLLKAASAGRDLVRAYAYTGLDPDNENQRNFHDFLRRHGYKVVSKDIRKYGDGKVKANLDIELVVDMMKTARNLDIAIVISGDGDFAPAIRAVQETGVRVEVISFRGNTSSDLIEVADVFTEITQVAKVDKGSSRSGRRVADDEEDLSMTEVPDKQSEGTGSGRRGRGGRGRTRPGEAEPTVAARGRGRGRPPERERAALPEGAVAAVTSTGAPLVALPGERLSKIAPAIPTAGPAEAGEDLDDEMLDVEELGAAEGAQETVEGAEGAEGAEGRRRRRRRGGRGRGRGRGREDGVTEGQPVAADEDADVDLEPEDLPQPPKRPAFAFGSVWDSQIGMPAATPTGTIGTIPEDEDLDEPPIPEYLIAERRQRDGRRGPGGPAGHGGGRGRASYAAAIERERFGGGRGSGGGSRYGEPSRGPARELPPRSDRPAPRPQRSGSSDEPWSEVPPELEAMLRAQMTGRGGRPEGRPEGRPAQRQGQRAVDERREPVEAVAEAPTRGRGRATRPAAAPAGVEAVPAEVVHAASDLEAPATAPRGRGRAASPRTSASRTSGARTSAPAPAAEASAPEAPAAQPEAAPKRRTARPKAATSNAVAAATTDAASAPAAPKRRAAAKKAPDAASTPSGAAEEAPKRRATRKKAEPEA